VRNEARHVEATLRAMLKQDYPADRFEVILADGRSDDDTVAIARRLQGEFPNLRIFDNPGRLSSAARNVGVRHGRGDWFVVVDGHCEVRDRRYLRHCEAAFVRSGADCLGRPQPLEITGATAFQRAVALARRSWIGHNPSSHIYSDRPGFVEPESVAVAYRRSVFADLGGFDERFDACEDVEFNHRVARAGMRCWFEPRIALPYVPRSTASGLFRQMGRYGAGRWRLFRKHPETLSKAMLAPPVFLLALAATLLAGLFVPAAAVAFALLAGVYVSVVLGASCALAWRSRCGPAVAARLPLVIACVHFGFAWGVLRQAARRG
jgi:succinoglycan biosynthesis protein ExoA